MPGPQLYFACRTQIEKDLTSERAAYFAFYLSHRPALKLVFLLAEKLPVGLRGLVCLFYSALTSARPFTFPAGGVISVEKFRNEKHQIDQLGVVLNKFNYIRWSIPKKRNVVYSLVFFGQRALRQPQAAYKFWRISRKFCCRYPLYVALRATEAAFNYFYFREVLRQKRPIFLVSSSDGNPYGRALMAAAFIEKIPLVFVSHGVVASRPVRAKADLAVFFGAKAEQEYREQNSLISQTLYYGFKQSLKEIRPIGKLRLILICLAHAPDLCFLAELCAGLSRNFTETRIKLRPHPNGLARPAELRRSLGGGAAISTGRSLQHDLEGVDLVLAAGSTVHLECLLGGVPTIYLPALDCGRNATLPFLREDWIFHWGKFEKSLPLERISKFYGRTEFRERLSEYLNLDFTYNEFLLKLDQHLSQLMK